MKLLYFAWVRERIGKPEEEIELPAGGAHGRRTGRVASARGEEYAYAFENAEGDPRRDRPRSREARRADRRRARDRLLPADDGG